MENTIIFISGVSGSGKGTLLEGLFSTYREFAKVQSYTSRPMRDGEKNGDKYNFIASEEFKRGIANDEFLEYALVHQKYYYGTKKKDIKDKIRMGLIPVKEIDMHGLEKLRREENPLFNYFSIFLDVPENIMIERIHSRQKIAPEELERRLESSHYEREKAKILCDHYIDATGTIQEIFEKVSNVLSPFF